MKFAPLLAGILAATSTSALAAASLEFDDVTLFGGTISYGGADGVDPLVGTDIVFDLVTGVGTLPSGSLEIVGGKLNFTTGPNISEGVALDTFAAGGTFVLTGTVIKPDLSVVASGILLTGHFSETSIVIGLGGGNGLFSGIGVDTKNPDLLDYYGLSSSLFEFAHTDIAFAAAGAAADGSFTAAVRDADLVNVPVPEASTVLGGLGLVAVAGIAAMRRLRG